MICTRLHYCDDTRNKTQPHEKDDVGGDFWLCYYLDTGDKAQLCTCIGRLKINYANASRDSN